MINTPVYIDERKCTVLYGAAEICVRPAGLVLSGGLSPESSYMGLSKCPEVEFSYTYNAPTG
jgi:hypothetical protein